MFTPEINKCSQLVFILNSQTNTKNVTGETELSSGQCGKGKEDQQESTMSRLFSDSDAVK
jgi:hypothetical protein